MQTLTRLVLTVALALAINGAFEASAAEVSVHGLTCEYRVDPFGIDAVQPRLGWKLQSDARGVMQTAYQVLVASRKEKLTEDDADLWNPGTIESGESVHVVYGGNPLVSRQACYWKVRVWTTDGAVSPWSETAFWSMGLLKASDWEGQWIGLDSGLQPNTPVRGNWIWFSTGKPLAETLPGERFFRKTITLPDDAKIASAFCRATADNEFKLYVNGELVAQGADAQFPAEANLAKLLKPGDNVIAASAVNHHAYANPAGFLAYTVITLSDGKTLEMSTDDSWKSSGSEQPGWSTAGFDDTAWKSAQVFGANGIQPWGEVAIQAPRDLPARHLRREFDAGSGITRATAYISGQGVFELYVNGQRIGDQVLAPACSEFDKRVYYMTFDVTKDTREGANALGVLLGNGRYLALRGTFHRHYGYPKLLMQLEVEHSDGSVQRIVSDASWKLSTDGPIRANNEFDGEVYDARMEIAGWSEPGFDDVAWQAVEMVGAPGGVLAAQMQEPIRVTEVLKPKSLKQPAPGVYIYDMGQNMVGWCRLKVDGPAGTAVQLRHAETIQDDGTLYMANLRSAKVTDVYTLKGGGPETYEPRFVYHGFRYVELTGYPGTPDLNAIEGCAVHDDVQPAGEFVTSNALLNRIHRNLYWGTRGNYRSMPTDCPQRDERQGWLGDRSEESRGETYLFQVAPFYAKWVQDMDDAQNESGSVPDVCPSYYPLYNDDVTWPSSFIIIPGALYDQYGDLRVIERHYDGMKQWIDHMTQYVEDGIISKDSYGDWCSPPESPELIHSNDPKRKTNASVLATTYFYRDVDLMARYAELLEKPDDAAQFRALAATLKETFNKRFLNEDAHDYDNGSQTASVLPLAFGMVPDEQVTPVFDTLVDKILVGTKGHVGTGLIGGQWLTRVLSDGGRPDVVYTIANQTTYPSWGYMIEKDATTFWELWNGDTADPSMNSHNHVMLAGDVVLWFYEFLGGIRPDPQAPGFKQIVLKPVPVAGLDHVRATHESRYGLIASDWTHTNGRFQWKVTVPPNTAATVHIPTNDAASVMESGANLAEAKGVTAIHNEVGAVTCTVSSGMYTFESALP
ncbi:MAG: family 78 glycoside hydrolase catalytic domain [Candidatus Hydrogenedentes bacterium]|nr:family 78 glycoside hydrolase catalytic domain [Candidatus Hydrogenedentota bacterium]